MKKFSLKATLGISGLALLAVGVAVDSNLFNFSGLALRFSRALDFNITLNHSNAPTLSGGSGTMTDEHSVTWEYSNCASYATGHVKINNNGYFGISSSSVYGYTFIEALTATFTADEIAQDVPASLWLLTSTDGINWTDMGELTSEVSTSVANNCRYVRFKNYDEIGNPTISITSISIDYKCNGGVSPTEDNDGAKFENVVSVKNVTYSRETTNVSPLGSSTEAVSFTKQTSGTEIIISFGHTYKIGEIAYKKVEFDMYTTVVYNKTIQLTMNSSTVGTSIQSEKHSAYVYKAIPNHTGWYHAEVPVTAFVSLISGYTRGGDKKDDDIPASNLKNKEINAIKINAGTCVIDNLRITGEQCDYGLYNNGTSFVKNTVYWFKTTWVGKLLNADTTFTFEGTASATQIAQDDPNLLNGSPFYIRAGDSSGSVTATANIKYKDHTGTHIVQVSNALTITEP